MTSPDRCPDPLPFDLRDPDTYIAYVAMLDLFLGGGDNLRERTRDLEEVHGETLGMPITRQITGRAIADAVDIENPRAELLG